LFIRLVKAIFVIEIKGGSNHVAGPVYHFAGAC
jgi:hypothetical protein